MDVFEINAPDPIAISSEQAVSSLPDRRAAALVDALGKHEPRLRENGIPSDVLAKLLPGNDEVVLDRPVVAGGLAYRFVKRAFDIVSTGCALVLLAIPMLVIASKIKRESPGPVIYAQDRVGKNGRIFKVYKFRSMYIDAESRGAQWAQGDDPRVTPFGKVMRKTRLDEIPQFWKILASDISLCLLRVRQNSSANHTSVFLFPSKESRVEEVAYPFTVSPITFNLRVRRSYLVDSLQHVAPLADLYAYHCLHLVPVLLSAILRTIFVPYELLFPHVFVGLTGGCCVS